MRILYHHRTMGDGAEGVHIREMIQALRQLDHEVRVVSIVGEPTETRTAQNHRWQRVRDLIPPALYELAEIGYNPVGAARIARAIREFDPHVIYDRYNSYSNAALIAARRARRPVLLEVNAPVAFERTNYDFMRLRFPRLAERYERRIFAQADHIVTVSSALRDYLVRERDTPTRKISVIPNAINPEHFDAGTTGETIRERHGLKGRIVIGFVGSLRAWHGIDLLMAVIPQVLERLPQCHFLIVGAGELESEFRRHVMEKRLTHRVTMTGWVRHSEVPPYIAAMDVTLMPYSNFYGSPIKVFEYMALGKPVVAPALGPLQEVIDHGHNGILVQPGSQDALREAILSLAGDEHTRNAIGKNAKATVLARHTWRHNAQRVVEMLELLTRPATGKKKGVVEPTTIDMAEAE